MYTAMSTFLKGYVPVTTDLGGYGDIECYGNETKLEECAIRKVWHPVCYRAAFVSQCSNGISV